MSPAARGLPPRSSPLRCTASTIRSPLGGHHAGKEPVADQRRARRDHHLGEAGGIVEEALLERAGLGVVRAQRQVDRQRRHLLRIAAQQRHVPGPDGVEPRRAIPGVDGDERQPGPGKALQVVAHRADHRRLLAHAELVQAFAEAELLDSVRAWVARSGGSALLSRTGSSRRPRKIAMTMPPMVSGIPTQANSK